jgi:predicted lipoprotein
MDDNDNVEQIVKATITSLIEPVMTDFKSSMQQLQKSLEATTSGGGKVNFAKAQDDLLDMMKSGAEEIRKGAGYKINRHVAMARLIKSEPDLYQAWRSLREAARRGSND